MSYPTCSHLKSNGIPCASPALRGKTLCYFHQRDLDRTHQYSRLRRKAETMKLHLPPLETAADVQTALFKVIDALAANCIEPRRAAVLLFALQQASSNLRAAPKAA